MFVTFTQFSITISRYFNGHAFDDDSDDSNGSCNFPIFPPSLV